MASPRVLVSRLRVHSGDAVEDNGGDAAAAREAAAPEVPMLVQLLSSPAQRAAVCAARLLVALDAPPPGFVPPSPNELEAFGLVNMGDDRPWRAHLREDPAAPGAMLPAVLEHADAIAALLLDPALDPPEPGGAAAGANFVFRMLARTRRGAHAAVLDAPAAGRALAGAVVTLGKTLGAWACSADGPRLLDDAAVVVSHAAHALAERPPPPPAPAPPPPLSQREWLLLLAAARLGGAVTAAPSAGAGAEFALGSAAACQTARARALVARATRGRALADAGAAAAFIAAQAANPVAPAVAEAAARPEPGS
ncbi:MAG: hypothetical protein J3K34DRAFT_524540 [Monoraphidium minutum]|nr:MAG: hypothetical protein J3K34DRAFT_524540 [Monoraphidium minutum]